MEIEIYEILKKHKLPLKKREEVLTDLLLFSVSQQRELLIAYEKYKDGWTDKSESERINFMVDSYLRNL